MQKPLISNAEKQAVRARLCGYCLNNYVSLLARKTSLSRTTVSKFFNEGKLKADNEDKIYDAALELIREKEENLNYRLKLRVQLGIIGPGSQ